MKLKNLTSEELELMSYTDLTYMMIKENKKTMNTKDLFKEICNLLGYSESQYEDKIGDFYTSLTMDKRFVLLENNEWDIRDNHSVEIILDEDDEDDDNIEIIGDEEIEEEKEEDEESTYDDENDIDDEDDMADLSIIDDDEELED